MKREVGLILKNSIGYSSKHCYINSIINLLHCIYIIFQKTLRWIKIKKSENIHNRIWFLIDFKLISKTLKQLYIIVIIRYFFFKLSYVHVPLYWKLFFIMIV